MWLSRLRSGERSAKARATIFSVAFVAFAMLPAYVWAADDLKDDKSDIPSKASNGDSARQVNKPMSRRAVQRPGTRPGSRPSAHIKD